MKKKIMEFPRILLIGPGVLLELPAVLEKIDDIRDVLLITGEKSYRAAGRKVEEILQDGGYEVRTVRSKEVTKEELNRVLEEISGEKFDIILGVGGGTKIDMAKLVADRLDIQYVSIPTIASHDGITSPRASISEPFEQISVQVKTPIAIVADTEVISKAPYRYLAAGAADVLANITAIKDWQLAKRLLGEEYSSTAALLALDAARMILKNAKAIKPGLLESVWIVVKALSMSGVAMSIAGSSRPASGSEHMFAHALARRCGKKALHGEMCGLGTIMMMYLHGGPWEKIKETLREIGAPTTAKELEIRDEDIIWALTHAHKMRERYTILGTKGISEKAAWEVAKITGVIE